MAKAIHQGEPLFRGQAKTIPATALARAHSAAQIPIRALRAGGRRAGVKVAAGGLQKAGFIHYRSGQMTITDRPGLKSGVRECYGITRRTSGRLFNRAIKGGYRR
jgi:hypothetical protein